MTLSMVTLHSSDKLLYCLTCVTFKHLKWYSCSLLTECTEPVVFEHLIFLSILNINFPEELEQDLFFPFLLLLLLKKFHRGTETSHFLSYLNQNIFLYVLWFGQNKNWDSRENCSCCFFHSYCGFQSLSWTFFLLLGQGQTAHLDNDQIP